MTGNQKTQQKLREFTYSLHAVNDRNLVLGSIGVGILGLGLLRDQRPDRIQVDGRAEELVVGLVEVTHTNLAKVARVVLVKVDAVVVLTTGVTATTRVLAVLADATITHGHVTTLLASLLQSGRLHDAKTKIQTSDRWIETPNYSHNNRI